MNSKKTTVKILRDLTALPDTVRGGAVTIGNFDGVHRGHQALIEKLKQEGKRLVSPVVVMVFEPHPLEFLNPGI